MGSWSRLIKFADYEAFAINDHVIKEAFLNASWSHQHP